MKYKYKFYRDPLDSLRMILPEQIDMFSDFIEQIATDDLANEVIKAIDSVQKGDKDEEEIMINTTSVLIKPEITTITLSDLLYDPSPDQYIETDEFRELVVIWKEKLPIRYIDNNKKY